MHLITKNAHQTPKTSVLRRASACSQIGQAKCGVYLSWDKACWPILKRGKVISNDLITLLCILHYVLYIGLHCIIREKCASASCGGPSKPKELDYAITSHVAQNLVQTSFCSQLCVYTLNFPGRNHNFFTVISTSLSVLHLATLVGMCGHPMLLVWIVATVLDLNNLNSFDWTSTNSWIYILNFLQGRLLDIW